MEVWGVFNGQLVLMSTADRAWCLVSATARELKEIEFYEGKLKVFNSVDEIAETI